jgi:hypothetical protein
LSEFREEKDENAMFIIAQFGGLVLGGSAFALLKRMGQSSYRHNPQLQIV